MEQVVSFIELSKRDPKAEFECKLLSAQIKTKDVADRLIKTIRELTIGDPVETSFLRVAYPDYIRVEVEGAHNIQKVCATNSFKGVPLNVQKKGLYRNEAGKDSIEYPDLYSKFTLRMEEKIRNDWDASPNDSKTTSVRILNRRSYKTIDEFFQIDFSMVKTRKEKKHTLRDVLKENHTYELEIEFVKRNTDVKSADILESLKKVINRLVQTFQGSEFILSPVIQEQYIREFKSSSNVFVNPVTLTRKHINDENPYNILKGYTVTIKADGERWGLYVARDRKLMRIASRTFAIAWTGMTAINDSFHGTFLDGEFIPQKNVFCIFDIYHYKGRSTTNLPLMKTDDDTVKNPLQSRLGCARQFVSEIQSHFVSEATSNMFKIETKTFLAGDGASMETAIKELLDTKYEYETDGLIFTPRASAVAPKEDRDKNTWLRVYKWKPPHQNSIDFLLKLSGTTLFDPVLGQEVRKGELYISRSASDTTVLYPRETMTGEYVPRELPADLKERALANPIYIPAPFQPSTPKDEHAHQILVPVDGKGLCFDEDKNRVEDDTIVECSYHVETLRWTIMRTRYDKTYRYRVRGEPEFGNNRRVADDIWSSIHIPVSEDMIRNCTQQIEELKEYYIEDINRKKRVLENSYTFHKKIKGILYKQYTKEGNTLLEFGSGIGGDKFRWSQSRLSKVVGIEPSLGNIKQASARYLDDKKKNPEDYVPAILYVQGDMTEPLYQQEDPKFKILSGEEKATTKYLEQFEDMKKFDVAAAQFVIHYACESEETFRIFAKNVATHCKDTFFGTCLDGKSVYTLLAGKQSHLFTNGKDVGGEYVKQYEDRESWVNEFGMAISVSMESFETTKEYLVPFDKIVQIFEEEGFTLHESTLFSEIYASQKESLSQELQNFSFLNRTFVFKRGNKKEEVIEKVETEIEEKPKEKKIRKLKKGGELKEVPVLFHAAGEDKGEFRTFSNMAEYPIQISDVKYPTVEHYFQVQKAKEFGDKEIEDKMMETPSSKAVKALGKKVKNFQKEIWDEKRQEIMMRAVRAKFTQHPELQKQLLETGDREIGDADARDSFWGIGTSENTEKSKDPSKWKGQNKLGKLLMALRDDFKQS
jgi:ribA/ribD-fused uncharacterized protein